MPRVTKAMLLAENVELKRRGDEQALIVNDMIEQLQDLCDDYGCPGGAHRINWLRECMEAAYGQRPQRMKEPELIRALEDRGLCIPENNPVE